MDFISFTGQPLHGVGLRPHISDNITILEQHIVRVADQLQGLTFWKHACHEHQDWSN